MERLLLLEQQWQQQQAVYLAIEHAQDAESTERLAIEKQAASEFY